MNRYRMVSFGETLCSLRKSAGLSQEQLAQKLGVSRQALGKWERGEAEPDLAKLAFLSRVLGISSDELLGLEKKEETAPDSGGDGGDSVPENPPVFENVPVSPSPSEQPAAASLKEPVLNRFGGERGLRFVDGRYLVTVCDGKARVTVAQNEEERRFAKRKRRMRSFLFAIFVLSVVLTAVLGYGFHFWRFVWWLPVLSAVPLIFRS